MNIYSRRIKTSPAISNNYQNEKIKLNKRIYDDDFKDYNGYNDYNDSISKVSKVSIESNNNNNNNKRLRGDEYIKEIWCYLRVSEGPIITPDNEPIYESTHKNMRKNSEYSHITGITSAFSLQIEDDIVVQNNTKKNSSNGWNNNNKKHVQQHSKFKTKFPVLAKARYSQLT